MTPISIITDSSCDVAIELTNKWNVYVVQLDVMLDNGEPRLNCDVDNKEFYDAMRKGSTAKTSAINTESFRRIFDRELAAGRDVLYIGFSSGLSTTYNSARVAAEELQADYPERKIRTIDSLCASLGQGMLLKLAVDKRDSGASFEELGDYVENTKMSIAHWFTVDDLQYLRRGGRVAASVALIGGVLGIKPVMHMDNAGKLTKVSQVRGRKASLTAIVERFKETAVAPSPVFISHGDCEDDAKLLASMLKSECGIKDIYINYVGPVIGAHSGPGTLALFFLGKER